MRNSLNTTGLPWRMAAMFALSAMALTVAFPIASDTASAGSWKGTEATEGDVTVIKNPKAGYESPKTVELEELWRLGGDTDDEDEFFGVIADIKIDASGNVYLLDSQINEVKVYTSDGEFVRSIGREGEGPGEFRGPQAMFFTKDGNIAVVQLMPGKIVVLTPEGEPVGEMPLPKPEDGGFQMLQGAQSNGNGEAVLHLARQQFDQQSGIWQRTSTLVRVNEDGEELGKYSTKTNKIEMANATMVDKEWDTFERRWLMAPDGRIYAAESYDDYAITIYSADGKREKVITREYEHRPRTAEEKQFWTTMMEFWAKQMNGKVDITDMTKDVESIYVRDNGEVWALTSDGARDVDDGTMGVFDVYNDHGHFVRNVTLKGQGDALQDAYFFVKDRVYVVTSFLQAAMSAQGIDGLYDDADEPEPMAVICYKLDADMLASR